MLIGRHRPRRLGRFPQTSPCRSGGGAGGVRREGLQVLLSGQGSTALRGPDLFGCGRTCDPAGRVPQVQDVRLDGAPDPVYQSALTSCCAAETCTHSRNCAEDRCSDKFQQFPEAVGGASDQFIDKVQDDLEAVLQSFLPSFRHFSDSSSSPRSKQHNNNTAHSTQHTITQNTPERVKETAAHRRMRRARSEAGAMLRLVKACACCRGNTAARFQDSSAPSNASPWPVQTQRDTV